MTAHRVINRAPRAALLLETMLALAIFVMAGTAILTLVDRAVEGMNRSRLAEGAADLARSAIAKMEAGIETPRTLNGPVRAWSADDAGAEANGDGQVRGGGVVDALPAGTGWELKIDTEPSQFTGLTRVTVKAFKRAAPDSEQVVASYTLRQLVRLGGKGEERAGGADDLAEQAKRGVRAGWNQQASDAARRGGGK